LILNYSWKTISGWIRHSGKVISQNMIEREMDNCGSKSAILAVKEQRVDGSCYIIYYKYLDIFLYYM